jgi:hypothetical protein
MAADQPHAQEFTPAVKHLPRRCFEGRPARLSDEPDTTGRRGMPFVPGLSMCRGLAASYQRRGSAIKSRIAWWGSHNEPIVGIAVLGVSLGLIIGSAPG